MAGGNPSPLTSPNYIARLPRSGRRIASPCFSASDQPWYVKAIHGSLRRKCRLRRQPRLSDEFGLPTASICCFSGTRRTHSAILGSFPSVRRPHTVSVRCTRPIQNLEVVFRRMATWSLMGPMSRDGAKCTWIRFQNRATRSLSPSGGWMPTWRKDGGEVYFLTDDRTMMAVRLTVRPGSLFPSVPVRLFQVSLSSVRTMQDAPSADGQRFLINVPLDDDRPQGIHLIHNWKASNAAYPADSR